MTNREAEPAGLERQPRELDAFEKLAADSTLVKILATYLLGEIASKNNSPQQAEIYLHKIRHEINHIIASVRAEDEGSAPALQQRMRDSFDDLIGAISFQKNRR